MTNLQDTQSRHGATSIVAFIMALAAWLGAGVNFVATQYAVDPSRYYTLTVDLAIAGAVLLLIAVLYDLARRDEGSHALSVKVYGRAMPSRTDMPAGFRGDWPTLWSSMLAWEDTYLQALYDKDEALAATARERLETIYRWRRDSTEHFAT